MKLLKDNICTYKPLVTCQLSCQPQERLLEVVVGFGRNVVVLKVLLSMESDSFGFNLSLLYVHLISTKDDRDIFANSDKITFALLDLLINSSVA